MVSPNQKKKGLDTMNKHFYVVLDTETATLPFVGKIADGDEQVRTNIAIAKPLVYDIGWVIIDRLGNIYKRVNHLVQETFFVPNVFNTAYYKDKRNIYMAMFQKGEIDAKPWNDIMDELITDCVGCRAVAAYNAPFDFKKSIVFTEHYIDALYSDNYNEWERKQYGSCMRIKRGKSYGENPDYLTPLFHLRDSDFPIIDLWGLACDRLINTDRYRDYCLAREMWTKSAKFFSTSAEAVYKYMTKQDDFIESHTALDDAIIESEILAKCLKKGKVEPEIKPFPFRALGKTYEYAAQKKNKEAFQRLQELIPGIEMADAEFDSSMADLILGKMIERYEREN